MISISAPSFDPIGNIIIQPLDASELEDIERRVSRIKTLDGGAVANDTGHSVADRTLNVTWRYTAADFELMKRFVQLYPRLLVSTPEAVFSAIPQRLTKRAGEASITLLVMQKLS